MSVEENVTRFMTAGRDKMSKGALEALRTLMAAESPEDLDAILRREVAGETKCILELLKGCDAFDVVELMRLRELPIAPDAALESGYDGSAAAIELIALILSSRDATRSDRSAEGDRGRPHELIPELHTRAKRILDLATLHTQVRKALQPEDAVARLALDYQSYMRVVRALNYESIQEAQDSALFDDSQLEEVLVEHVGFSYTDFLAVRRAMQALYSERLTTLRDRSAAPIMATQREGREPTADEIETFREAITDMMFLPGERASFIAADLVEGSGVDEGATQIILESFSLPLSGSHDAVEGVLGFLQGRNPFWARGLLRDGESFLMTSSQIGMDSFRARVEEALKRDAKAWKRYERCRRTVSEDLAVAAVAGLMGAPTRMAPLEYFAPREGVAFTDLGAACPTPQKIGLKAEADALLVTDDVAICVEVKARTVAEAARRGDVRRLGRELATIFGEGARQAKRLEDLINTSGGICLATGEWLDLSHVREVRSIVVGLDYFGPLSVSLGELFKAQVVDGGHIPWIVSLHDLQVIQLVLDRPAEFLAFLRGRTAPGVASLYQGIDELDMLMLFMDRGLYVEPDPDEMRSKYPATYPPTPEDYERHQDSARPTIVGTHTDPLDAWMCWREGSASEEYPKPAVRCEQRITALLDFLSDGAKPGWFRMGADLLGLSGEAQVQLAGGIDELIRRGAEDRGFHTTVFAYAGLAGYPTVFAAVAADGQSPRAALGRLELYLQAKKHQVQSDRSLGLVFSAAGHFLGGLYDNTEPGPSEELDRLGRQIGLADPPGGNPR